jgi:thiol:disulfide interchange protein DsbA
MKRREFALAGTSAALAGLIHLPARAQDAPFKEGADYLKLKTAAPVEAQPPQVEVIEFFSYVCPHCMHFEPEFEKWKSAVPKDVSVRLEHVGFNSSFEPLQRIFYALQAVGKVDQLHTKVFSTLQVDHKRLDKPDVLFAWVAEQGVDRAKFEAAYNSFGVATRMRRAVQLQEAYQVEGTPALGIAGLYYTDGSMARGFDRMLKLTDELIAQQRKK